VSERERERDIDTNISFAFPHAPSHCVVAVMSSSGAPPDPSGRVSKFANHNAFASVDEIVSKPVNTDDTQDSWNRFASDNKHRPGLKRANGYTSHRHAPAFPKLGQWRADPSGANDGDGIWTGNNEKLVAAAEANRRKKIWQDEQDAAREQLKAQKTASFSGTSAASAASAAPAASATSGGGASAAASADDDDQPAAKKGRASTTTKKKDRPFNPKDVFLAVSVDNHAAGVMHFKLFDKVVPRTAENFRALCAGNWYVVVRRVD
jgi:hypothetical protein